MSAPIGRDTPMRKVVTHTRKISALSKRPAPVVEAVVANGIDSAVYMEFLGKTISNDAMTNLTGGTVGQEVVKGDAMTVDNSTGKVTLAEDGIYLAQLNVLWDDAFAFKKITRITWVLQADQDNVWDQDVIGESDGSTGTDLVTTMGVRFVNITGGNNFIQGAVLQASGTSRGITTADFTVVQLAAITFP